MTGNTCVLFGDGAGAVVLQAKEGQGDVSDSGVLATKLYADGTQWDKLLTTAVFPVPKMRVYLDGRQRSIQICH